VFLLVHGAFHKAQSLRQPSNVTLVFLPPYSPTLNPIERLWHDRKDWLWSRASVPVNPLRQQTRHFCE
jgi:transposase